MPEIIENSVSTAESGLDDIAALLAEQLTASHAATARCFAMAADADDYSLNQRDEALRVASRLMHATAAAANAIKRIKGGEFHHRITVDRVDYAAEKAARRARDAEPREPTLGEITTRMLEADIANDLKQIHDRLAAKVQAP